MNRRSFLKSFFGGTAGLIVAPQIVTHGLHLRTNIPCALELIEDEWTSQDVSAYQSLPFYLASVQIDQMKTFSTFAKMCKSRSWKKEMGSSILTPQI